MVVLSSGSMNVVTGELQKNGSPLVSWGRYLCFLQSVFHCVIPKPPHHQLVFRHSEWRLDATLTEIVQYKEVTLHRKSPAGRNVWDRGTVATGKWDGDNQSCGCIYLTKDNFEYKVTPSPNFFYCCKGKIGFGWKMFSSPSWCPNCPALLACPLTQLHRHSLSWPHLDFSVVLHKVTLLSFSLGLAIFGFNTWSIIWMILPKEKSALSICVTMVESAWVWEPNRVALTYHLPPSWCILMAVWIMRVFRVTTQEMPESIHEG